MQNKLKNIIIISLTTLLLAAGITIYILINNNKNSLNEIQGTVLVADQNYVIIESNNEDYLINDIKNIYEVGDTVKFTYKTKNMDENCNPKIIKIEEEILIERIPDIESNDIRENSANSSSNQTSDNTQTSNSNTSALTPNKDNVSADEEVLSYLTELESEFKSGSVKESLKNGFITVVDFLFYNGSIKGHTFNELSDSAKLKVLSMALYFDDKINTYFPGYKENISSTTNKIYTEVKTNIVESYLNLTTKICSSEEELCTSAKENFSKLKTNFNLTWSLIKDIANDGVSKLKDWYEIFSGK